MAHAVLLDQLEKWLHLLLKLDCSEKQTTMTLYSIDYVRKFLMNRQFNNRFVFDRLDEARVAEMKNDLEFWQFDDQVQNSICLFLLMIDLNHSLLFINRMFRSWIEDRSINTKRNHLRRS